MPEKALKVNSPSVVGVTGPPQVVVQSPVRQWPEASPVHPVRPQMRPPHEFGTVSDVLCPGASLRPAGYAAVFVTTAQTVSGVRLTRLMLRRPAGAVCRADAPRRRWRRAWRARWAWWVYC